MPSEFKLPTSFWEDFVRSQWKQGPVLLPQVFPEPLASVQEITSILRHTADAYRRRVLRTNMSLYVNRGKLEADIEHYLITSGDSTFAEYCERIDRDPLVKEFTLSLFGCQVYHPALWARTRTFLEGLYAQTGYVIGHADVDIFVGNYRRTPVGIHRDAASNFSFVVHGKKEMMFWPPEAISRDPHSCADRNFPGSTPIQGSRGDIIFWPFDYWHIATSDVGWAVTLNVAIYLTGPFALLLRGLGSDPRLKALPSSMDSGSATDGPEEHSLPQGLRHGLDLYRGALNHQSLDDTLSELWIRRVSAGGFASVPPPGPLQSISEDDIIAGSVTFPIVAIPTSDGRLLVSANGHVVACNHIDKVAHLIHVLNSTSGCCVGDLLNEIAVNTSMRANLLRLLAHLESFGAFSVRSNSLVSPSRHLCNAR